MRLWEAQGRPAILPPQPVARIPDFILGRTLLSPLSPSLPLPARPAAAQPYPARFAVCGRASSAPPLGSTIETRARAGAAESSGSPPTPGCGLLSEPRCQLVGCAGWCLKFYTPPKPDKEVGNIPLDSWLSGHRTTHLPTCTQVAAGSQESLLSQCWTHLCGLSLDGAVVSNFLQWMPQGRCCRVAALLRPETHHPLGHLLDTGGGGAKVAGGWS